MQLKFMQIQSKMKASYQVLQNEVLVYNADIPLNFSGQKFSLHKNDRLLYSLSLDKAGSMANIIKSTKLDRHKYVIIWYKVAVLVIYCLG